MDESATIVDIDPRFIVRVDFYKGGIPIPVMYPIMLAAGKKRLAISNTGLIDKSETTLNCTDEDVRYAIIQVKAPSGTKRQTRLHITENMPCLLYTSDAADDLLCVDLGGRRIIKKKKKSKHYPSQQHNKSPYQHYCRH